MMKKILPVFASAVLFAACAAVGEDIPDGTDAVPAAAYADEPQREYDGGHSDTVSEDAPEYDITDVIKKAGTAPAEDGYYESGTAEDTAAETDPDGTPETGGISSVSLTFYSVSLRAGESRMPIVSMLPENAPDKSEIWTSSDSAVARVDELGNITAVSEGKCVVTVRAAAAPQAYAEVEVTVEPEPQLTYIDGILIANKTYALPSDYNPGVDPEAKAAFDEMQAAASEEGLNIYISSGFRSYEYQAGLYEGYVKRSGKAEADRYSARPGHSEHQTGLAFDMNTIDMTFADTAEYEWVKKRCAEYGFIIRYPEDGEEITGYMYEPWHIRYLGRETAKKVFDSGLTLEEYLGIDSVYKLD